MMASHNYADNKNLNSFRAIVEDLVELLQPECNVDIEQFIENKMFVNRGKFETISLDKQKANNTGVKIAIGSEEVQVLSLLGMSIDYK